MKLADLKMPQRSPFAIQELLGLNGTGNSSSTDRGSPQSSPPVGVSAVSYAPTTPHHKIWDYMPSLTNHLGNLGNLGNLTASRMAYLNAQAAVAAAFLPPPHPHPAHHVAHHQVHQAGPLPSSPGINVHPATAHAQHVLPGAVASSNHHQHSPSHQHTSTHGEHCTSSFTYIHLITLRLRLITTFTILVNFFNSISIQSSLKLVLTERLMK